MVHGISEASRRAGKSPEDQFFYAEDQTERLLEKLDDERAQVAFLRNALASVCTGHWTPTQGLQALGLDPQRLSPFIAELPTVEEVAARYDEVATRRRQELAAAAKPVTGSVVYYVQINQLVKIGTTQRFVARMRSMYLDAHDVLAAEEGDTAMEHQRHVQFAHLRVDPRRELFKIADDLRDHMLLLRSDHPDPWQWAATLAA